MKNGVAEGVASDSHDTTTDGEYFAEDNDNGLLPILHGKDSKLIIRVQGKPPPQSKKAFWI